MKKNKRKKKYNYQEVKFSKKGFIIFKVRSGWIVQNTNKTPFENAHTHLKSYKAGIDAINFVIYRKIPNGANPYYLTSLKRLATDRKYIQRIDSKLNKDKKLSYRNDKKHIKKTR